MNRLERYKQRRSLRRKYLSAALLFFFLLAAGLLVVDYTTNLIMTGQRGIKMLSFENRQNSLEITLMNQKITINTMYINRDSAKLKGELERLFGS